MKYKKESYRQPVSMLKYEATVYPHCTCSSSSTDKKPSTFQREVKYQDKTYNVPPPFP